MPVDYSTIAHRWDFPTKEDKMKKGKPMKGRMMTGKDDPKMPAGGKQRQAKKPKKIKGRKA